MARTAQEAELATFNAKEMLSENAVKGTKVTFTDRLKVEVIKDTAYYRVGDILEPHAVVGQALVDQGIAKKIKD